jgi:hypothetical protein
MTRLIDRILPAVLLPETPPPIPMPGDFAFVEAMRGGDELLRRLRENSGLNAAARSVVSDVLARSHNTPFMTTVYEAVQEMKNATDQKPELANQLRLL